MLRNLTQNFLPWILFFIIINKFPHHILIAFIITIFMLSILNFKNLKNGFIISWISLTFLIILFLVIYFKVQWAANYLGLIFNSLLAIIAFISIVIKKPFTLQYAKTKISVEKWQDPLFIKINYLLTLMWGLMFSLGVILHILKFYCPSFIMGSHEGIYFLPSVFGIWFTKWFPPYYKEKHLRLDLNTKPIIVKP